MTTGSNLGNGKYHHHAYDHHHHLSFGWGQMIQVKVLAHKISQDAYSKQYQDVLVMGSPGDFISIFSSICI